MTNKCASDTGPKWREPCSESINALELALKNQVGVARMGLSQSVSTTLWVLDAFKA